MLRKSLASTAVVDSWWLGDQVHDLVMTSSRAAGAGERLLLQGCERLVLIACQYKLEIQTFP